MSCGMSFNTSILHIRMLLCPKIMLPCQEKAIAMTILVKDRREKRKEMKRMNEKKANRKKTQNMFNRFEMGDVSNMYCIHTLLQYYTYEHDQFCM